ncbi:hypothetical protein F4859DRAFT_337338 [Xylaria cf. heliscus]|nr:hypothetical protein F4859DRAFT_337338 [Xylaria cf. heliscus]
MESTVSRIEARERLHRRALSQASTVSSTMHSPKMTQSTSTSSQSRAMTPSNAPYTHGCHHSQGDRELVGLRQAPRLSRESSGESKQPIAPISSLLQERLQQERRAESERLASKWGAGLSSSTGDIRDGDILNSSGRRYKSAVERRPGSSHDDDSSQASMGAKQIEKAVSTLHKQNFDLKLELFHRREKQSALETRVEELETEHRELTDIQENLLAELVKRDKAIEEAVNMIVKLEARLDELVREKEMVRQIEADRSYQHSWSNVSDSVRTETPKPGDRSALLPIESKTLERMPSFLSDRSAQTQHLRSVVLQNRSSLRHIRKFSQVSMSSAEVSEVNHASPSVSMLSESSFVSIYGSKHGQDEAGLLPLGDALGMDGTFGERSPTPTMRRMNSLSIQKTSVPNRMLHLTRPATCLPDQVLPTNNVLRRGSPALRPEKPGGKANFVDAFRPSTSSRRKSVVTPTPQFMGSPSQARSRRKRSQTLQKVTTGYPTQKELANTHPLPPTPDTVSSSVLQTHQSPSSPYDSLHICDDACGSRHFVTSLPHGSEYLRSLASQEARPGVDTQKMSTSAVTGNRSGLPTPGLVKVNQDALLSDLSHLARSAANNTATGRPRPDSFVSDSDSDGGADARSDSESCDYWMRESYKPDKDNARFSTRHERGQPPSPDLFSFPADSEGWQPDAIFGALKGAGFLGSPDPALRRDPIDERGALLRSPEPDSLESTSNGPRPPSRRSSLNAQGAGHLLTSSLTGKTGRISSREGSVLSVDAKGRRNSIDGSGTRTDAGTTTKRSQYPPISGLQSRARGLNLNSLFRRSGSESYGGPSSATELTFPSSVSQRAAPVPPAHWRHLRRPSGRNSVPPPATMPWATRPAHVADDELARATPPPIMRNRPPLHADLVGSDEAASDSPQATDAGGRPATPLVENTTPAAPQNGGGVRKWLGLGRKASPRKIRAG